MPLRLAKKGEFSLVNIGRAVRLRTEEVEQWYGGLSKASGGEC